MTDNADIRRMFEKVAQQNHDLRRRVEKLENAPADLRNAAIDGGKGLLVKSGDETIRLGDNGIEHQDGPTPFPPEPPFVDAGGETVKIQHTGLDVYENIAPRDFRRTQVHVSQDETFEPSLSTLAGFIDSPNGGMTHRLPGGEWHIGVVWETRSGKLSDLSETVLADVAPLVDADEIQEALDAAQERLDQAEQDFAAGNDARKNEIENLRDTVIPDLRESLEEGLSDEVTRLEGMITTAGGTSILRGVGGPVGEHDPDGLPAGAYYFQYDNLNADGQLEGIWVVVETEVGNEWSQSELDEVILPQVHVEQGTYGELHGERLTANTVEAQHLQADSVGVRELSVEDVFADQAVIDKIWADIVRARMLTAEEAFIGGALIKDNTIDVEKINVTEELTAAIGQFLTVKADMLEANAIDGMTITGSTMQTMPEEQRGIKLRAAQNDLVAYDQDGKQRVHIDGTTGHITAHNGEFRDGSVIGSSVIGGYVGTASTGKRVYMEGENLTARDANNDITAQLGPSGLALRDAGGTLQNIGNHIYGAEQFTAASGMNRGVTVNSASSANTWGSWVYGYLSKSSVITSNRYRVDVTFIIDGYARAAGAQTAVRFMVQPTDMNENLVDPRMDFFDRSIYTGDPLFAVPRSFTLTGTVTLNEAWPVGTPYRVRYAARTQNFDGTVRINNISIMMQPI